MEGLLKYALRRPEQFTLNNLQTLIAEVVGDDAGSNVPTRAKALELLASALAGRDLEYVSEVLAAEAQGKPAKAQSQNPDLTEILLEELSLEERQDYRELKTEVSSTEFSLLKGSSAVEHLVQGESSGARSPFLSCTTCEVYRSNATQQPHMTCQCLFSRNTVNSFLPGAN